ncbi:hypothetical protein JJJ17_00735 [Paracoccus caeni]|uniref:Nodulation protein NodH n=1 Tax=Paracoccus caeni TaxID=657651 RepID=A0A934VWY7_9RHOB|nr:sulfotransferase family 2 domain-containing protein [Paracoccus caeni]MBK4214442.1 hypothetical protein [Paracoccus caeni]
MTAGFTSFVIFAGMRTGSNLLESTLNDVPGIRCYGEAFNPYILGWPNTDDLWGITMAQRETDPLPLLEQLRKPRRYLSGFRYFHDHDPRVFDAIMQDRSCAKVILTRNPLESYVSTRLAWETDQWKLNETETPIEIQITYDGPEFRQSLSETDTFQQKIIRSLQISGQSAFILSYPDLRDTEVLTGLVRWLGRTEVERVDPSRHLVPQNPQDMEAKVGNFAAMQADLHGLDPFLLYHLPNYEPRRGPSVPSFVATEAGRGLLFMPVRGGPTAGITAWLTGLGALQADFTQTSLRQWKRGHPGHRSFTVLRHPLHRAWDAFLHLLGEAPAEMRALLRNVHRVPLPPDAELAALSEEQSRDLFLDFLGFLKRNLNGQTTLPVNQNWASQSEIIAGFARFGSPDAIIREHRMVEDLAHLAASIGVPDPQLDRLSTDHRPDFLSDRKLIDAAHAAYQRDYMAFGYEKTP